jgi:hypothetical protein
MYRTIRVPSEKEALAYAGPARGETLPAFFIFFSSLLSLRDLAGFFFASFFVSLAFDIILPPYFVFRQRENTPWFF